MDPERNEEISWTDLIQRDQVGVNMIGNVQERSQTVIIYPFIGLEKITNVTICHSVKAHLKIAKGPIHFVKIQLTHFLGEHFSKKCIKFWIITPYKCKTFQEFTACVKTYPAENLTATSSGFKYLFLKIF